MSVTGFILTVDQIAYPQTMIDLSQFGLPVMERYSVDSGTALLVERKVTGHVSSIQLTMPTYPSADSARDLLKDAEVSRILDRLVPGLSTLTPASREEVHGAYRVIRRAPGVVLTYTFPLEDDSASMVSASIEATEPNPGIDLRANDLIVELGPPNSRWFLDASGAVIEVEGSEESVRKVSISMNGPFLKLRTLSETLDEKLAESLVHRLLPSGGPDKKRINRFQSGGLANELYFYRGALVSYQYAGDQIVWIGVQLR